MYLGKKFDHPQLGEVEIGSLMTGNTRFMYPDGMEEISLKVTSFITKHARMNHSL